MAEDVRFESRPLEALAPRALHDLLKLRSDVFILEQGITTEPDVDGFDPDAHHVLGRLPGGRLVATARLRRVADGVKVERIVVAASHRGRGIGRALMAFVHEVLGGRAAVMSAQAHLAPWYEAQGWSAEGAPYDEGGVEHRRLTRVGTREP